MNEILQKDEVIIREIIAGARTLFEKYGLKKTTMEDIAREVGKGKSSLYYYFPSKYEIFEAVVEQEINEFFIVTQKAIEKASTAREKLKAYSKMRVCKIKKLSNLSHIIKDDLIDNISVLLNIKKKHERSQISLVREIINTGVVSGEFKTISKEDIDMLAFLIIAAFRGIELPLCTEKAFPDLTQQVEVIVDVMVEGIGK